MIIVLFSDDVLDKLHIFGAQSTKRALMQFANIAGPDQPAHSRRLIRIFVAAYRINGYCSICRRTECQDQTARMCTLKWTSAARINIRVIFPC